MTALINTEFKIEIQETEKEVHLIWSGRTRLLDPDDILDPYFETLISDLKGKTVIIDFRELMGMNSSTIPPLLSFFKQLNLNRIHTTVYYNQDSDWQKASFKPLKILTQRALPHIRIEGK